MLSTSAFLPRVGVLHLGDFYILFFVLLIFYLPKLLFFFPLFSFIFVLYHFNLFFYFLNFTSFRLLITLLQGVQLWIFRVVLFSNQVSWIFCQPVKYPFSFLHLFLKVPPNGPIKYHWQSTGLQSPHSCAGVRAPNATGNPAPAVLHSITNLYLFFK